VETPDLKGVSAEGERVSHPWAKFAGTWAEDDPLIAAWREAVEEYRRQMDEDPDIL
jgi:hypothetical protein